MADKQARMNTYTDQTQPSMEYVRRTLDAYAAAYQQLYRKHPRELRALENGWVCVNGAHMRPAELEFLTQQLQAEYQQQVPVRRSAVKRLIGWLSKH